jgi:hypothetical protein
VAFSKTLSVFKATLSVTKRLEPKQIKKD